MKDKEKCFQCSNDIDKKTIRLTDEHGINIYNFCSNKCVDEFIEEQNNYHVGKYLEPLIFKSL